MKTFKCSEKKSVDKAMPERISFNDAMAKEGIYLPYSGDTLMTSFKLVVIKKDGGAGSVGIWFYNNGEITATKGEYVTFEFERLDDAKLCMEIKTA